MSLIKLYSAPKKRKGRKTEDWNENETDQIKTQKNFDRTMKATTSTGHFEENFEEEISLEKFEDMENPVPTREMEQYFDDLLKTEKYESAEEHAQRRIGRRMANNMHRRFPGRGGPFAAHRLGQKHLGKGFGHIKGTLTMVITRTSYNIAFNLIVELWNPLDILTGGSIITAIQSQYAAGATFLSATFNAQGDLVLVYGLTSNLAITDTVIVHCQEVSYFEHLYGIVMGDMLQVGGGPVHKPGGQCVLSDASAANLQWPQQWYFTKKNFLGTFKQKPLNGGMFIDASQYLQQYQNILIGFPVDKENGIMFTAINNPGQVPGYQLSATFMWNFSHVIMNNHNKKGLRRYHMEGLESMEAFDSDEQ